MFGFPPSAMQLAGPLRPDPGAELPPRPTPDAVARHGAHARPLRSIPRAAQGLT
jgi:hypothetical protein